MSIELSKKASTALYDETGLPITVRITARSDAPEQDSVSYEVKFEQLRIEEIDPRTGLQKEFQYDCPGYVDTIRSLRGVATEVVERDLVREVITHFKEKHTKSSLR